MIHLGHNIFEIENEKIALHGEQEMFLDRLLIPCALSQLQPEQIAVISRYREQHIKNDRQFEHRDQIANIFYNCFKKINIKTSIEFGCGKFPLLAKNEYIGHYAVDIDDDAVKHCQNEGWNVNLFSSFNEKNKALYFEIIFAIYVFHFRVYDEELDFIKRQIENGAILIFNIIQDDDNHLSYLLNNFKDMKCRIHAIRGGRLSRKEAFYIIDKKHNNLFFNSITAFFEEAIFE